MANKVRLIDAEKCYCIAKAYHSDFEQNLANLHSLRELLDDCPTVDAMKWIPVTERLPEKEGTYLTYTDKERIHLDCFCIYPNHGTQFWVGGNGTVTHWMPLPEPPKGEMPND